jgi:Holliday junction resolvase RusA-like endonuclease
MADALFETPLAGSGPAVPAATGHEADGSRPLLDIHVVGIPAPQGSKNAFNNPHTGKAQMVESASVKLQPWRQDVKQAGLDAIAATPGYIPPGDGVGVVVDITFLLARPKGHYRTGRNAHLLRDGAPARPTTRPDVDKLIRSTLDALKVAGVYRDDSDVVTVTGRKVFASTHTGALIAIYTGECT